MFARSAPGRRSPGTSAAAIAAGRPTSAVAATNAVARGCTAGVSLDPVRPAPKAAGTAAAAAAGFEPADDKGTPPAAVPRPPDAVNPPSCAALLARDEPLTSSAARASAAAAALASNVEGTAPVSTRSASILLNRSARLSPRPVAPADGVPSPRAAARGATAAPDDAAFSGGLLLLPLVISSAARRR
jgi:hypothetical protein